MDYEKKYKEALENAIKCLKDGGVNQNSIDYIESIFPELKESKGVRIKGAIIDYLKDNNLTEWADWLEKQGEQKTAWSEEDEKMFNELIRYFKFSISVAGEDSEHAEKWKKRMNWLKSIKSQSHWKPSDEQIIWLARAADMSDKDSRMKQVLNELLSDLKKLKIY